MESATDLTRKQILEAARQLIIRQGFDATGVSEICQTAGVSKGAFYYHFSSKQALFLTLLNQWLETLDASFASIQTSSVSLGQQLQAMAASSQTVFSAMEDPIPVFLAFWSKAIQDKQTWQDTIEPFRRYQQAFEGLLSREFSSAGTGNDLSPADASRILVGMAIGILLQGLILPDDANWQDVLMKAIQLFNTGIVRSDP